jgi:hypothetical protein
MNPFRGDRQGWCKGCELQLFHEARTRPWMWSTPELPSRVHVSEWPTSMLPAHSTRPSDDVANGRRKGIDPGWLMRKLTRCGGGQAQKLNRQRVWLCCDRHAVEDRRRPPTDATDRFKWAPDLVAG